MAKKKAPDDNAKKPTRSTVTIPAELNEKIEEHIEEYGQTKQGFFIWLAKRFFREQEKTAEEEKEK